MPIVNHLNIKNDEGRVYCCLRNKVVELSQTQMNEFCLKCKMFAGTAKGRGVECIWNDSRNVKDPHIAADPYKEFVSNQKRKAEIIL